MLTALEQDKTRMRTAEKEELIAAIKEIINQSQNGRPISDDVL